MPDIELLGAIYPGVPAVDLPKSGGGTARFYDVSGALCTITVEEEDGEESYISDKTAQQVYDALEVGINPVFRFHDLRDNADAYIYASLSKLESTANGEELSLSSFQTDPMTAASSSDYFELTIAPPVEKTVSGSLISITDALAGPAINVTVAITPAQSGSGDPSPTNVRPISGFSAANIVVSPTTTAGDGTTFTVSFGTAGTVYGGTLDVTTGELTVDRAKTTVGAMSWSYYNTVVYSSSVHLKSNVTGEMSNLVCDTYVPVISATGTGSAGSWVNNTIRQKSDGNTIYIKDTRYTTAASFKSAMGDVEIVYTLQEPQTYQLTPTEVDLLLGTNNIWSDTGDTTLTYLADGRVNSLTALNMLLGNMYTQSADVSDREALQIIMGETE